MNIDKLIRDTAALYLHSGAMDEFARTLVNPVSGEIRTRSDIASLAEHLDRITDNIVLTLTAEGVEALEAFHGPRLDDCATHEEIYRSATIVSHFCNLAHQAPSFLVSQKANHASLSAVQNKLDGVPEGATIEQLEALMKGDEGVPSGDVGNPETVGQYL